MNETLITLQDAIAQGARDPAALMQDTLAGLEAQGRALNAVVATTPAEAAAELAALSADPGPRGSLWGLSLAHKDMFDRAGQPTGCGSRVSDPTPAKRSAPVLDHLRRAGALNLGRLHMAEWALGLTGHNDHLGRCLNPLDTARITGGSSSGSAAVVAAGIVPAALGSDTGGSIRVPAAMCGIVGLKPTIDRVSTEGCMPLAPSLDVIGPLARSVRDAARVFDVILGHTHGTGPHETAASTDAGAVTIALPRGYFFDDLAPEIAAAHDGWIAALRERGVTFTRTACDEADELARLNGVVLGYEAARTHRDRLRDAPETFGTQVRARLVAGQAVTEAQYRAALDARAGWVARFDEVWLAGADVLATPILRGPVPTAAETEAETPERIATILGEIGRAVRPFSYLGVPGLSLPIGRDGRGMPVALQLVARPGAEARLLQIGALIEASRPKG